ncbi:hypothetical protein [Amycolatopsis sp. FDAARGOS 1241]|nr:hypothetical protein [Amycolatopsis sp. FDAARGOS 1241]
MIARWTTPTPPGEDNSAHVAKEPDDSLVRGAEVGRCAELR